MAEELFSGRVTVNGYTTDVKLLSDGVIRWTEGKSQRSLNTEREVIGVGTRGPEVVIRALVEVGGGICCCAAASGGAPVRKRYAFQFMSDDAMRLFSRKLRQFVDSLDRPKRLFVVVNPFGGNKSATKIFDSQVKPLLEDAEIHFTVEETEHQLHAKGLAKTLDLSKFDGIVCVSGDGILVEVVNGLLEREDWQSAIKMPLGVIPAGTGNGMAKSLLDNVGEPCTATNAAHAIIRGLDVMPCHKRSLDVATISQGQTKFFSVLMLAWGLVADIDIESEKYRWMGSLRLDVYGLQRVLKLRRYNGSISFVPAPGFESLGEPSSYKDICGDENNFHSSDGSETVKIASRGYQGPDMDLESMTWRTVKGPFISVWLHNVPWGSEDTMAAPQAKFSDGYIDLIYIRDCSVFPLISLMTELNSGNHVNSPHVVYLKVKAFVCEPGLRADDPTKGGIIDSDGEVLARGKGTYKCDQKTLMAYDKFQLKVDQGLATLFSPV